MPWTQARDGNHIYFEVEGSGPPLVFVSGFFGIHTIWRQQVALLKDKYRCVVYDNRGYGLSDKPLPSAASGIAQHAEDMECVVEAANICEPIGLITHSMGGSIATTYSINNPGAVTGIVYTGSYFSGPQLLDLGLTYAAVNSAVSTPQRRVDFFCELGLCAEQSLEAAKWPLYAVQTNIHAMLQTDCTSDYSRIEVPTLVIQCDADPGTPVDPCATELVAALPNSRLSVVQGAHHFPGLVRPHETAELIASHFDATL